MIYPCVKLDWQGRQYATSDERCNPHRDNHFHVPAIMYIEMDGELTKSNTKNDCYGYNDHHVKKVRKKGSQPAKKLNYGHSDKCLND